jgi:hypothetical protein
VDGGLISQKSRGSLANVLAEGVSAILDRLIKSKRSRLDGGWYAVRAINGVVGFAVGPSMGSGHSTCSAEAGCRGSLIWFC